MPDETTTSTKATKAVSPASAAPAKAVSRVDSWDVEVFFDGACPLCRREIGFVRNRDRLHRLRWVDISCPDFDASSTGKTYEELMARIHARLPTDEWIAGVDVFRHIYSAIGWAPLIAVTRWPGIRQGIEWAYRVFARNRLRWTGRCHDRCHARSTP